MNNITNKDMAFQIRVTGILIYDSKILIVKQYLSDKRHWSLPGGRLEHCESMEQAIIREIYEETGITVEIDSLLYLCDVPPMNRVVHITFLLKYMNGEIRLPDNSCDENPISDVLFADIDRLNDFGFSEKFITLIQNGFPDKGSYMGDKANIGLSI